VITETLADEMLVTVAVLLLVAEVYALRMIRVLRKRLDGGHGDYLLRVVFRFGLVVTVAQVLTVVNAVLRLIDYTAFGDVRLMLFLAIESLFALAFLWTVWEIHHLPADRYAKDPTAKRVEPCECLCKEVNDAVATSSPATAVVD
jgi:hypothetical protein